MTTCGNPDSDLVVLGADQAWLYRTLQELLPDCLHCDSAVAMFQDLLCCRRDVVVPHAAGAVSGLFPVQVSSNHDPAFVCAAGQAWLWPHAAGAFAGLFTVQPCSGHDAGFVRAAGQAWLHRTPLELYLSPSLSLCHPAALDRAVLLCATDQAWLYRTLLELYLSPNLTDEPSSGGAGSEAEGDAQRQSSHAAGSDSGSRNRRNGSRGGADPQQSMRKCANRWGISACINAIGFCTCINDCAPVSQACA